MQFLDNKSVASFHKLGHITKVKYSKNPVPPPKATNATDGSMSNISLSNKTSAMSATMPLLISLMERKFVAVDKIMEAMNSGISGI